MTTTRRRAAQQAVNTRRLYSFEDLSGSYSHYASREHALPYFRQLCCRLWLECGPQNKPAPAVDFGTGTPHGGTRVSFCDFSAGRRIELAPGQRNLVVFLHEMTHASGFGTHGKGFVRKYFSLLGRYARCDEARLHLEAGLFGIKT